MPHPAPDAPPTRRQLREARLRAAQPQAPVMSTPIATLPIPGSETARNADTTATEVFHPSRRAMRAQRQATTGPAKRSHGQLVSRGALLSALGALTIVLPVAGLPTSGDTAGAQTNPVQGVAVTALEALGTPSDSSAPALLADPAAAGRAAAMELSRTAGEAPAQCSTGTTPASGTRAAFETEVSDQVVMPLQQGTFRHTSGYGTRNDPFRRGYSFHTGTDFAAPLGTPIHAVADGVVDYVGYGRDGRSNMLVIVRHEIEGTTYWTWNVHMYAPGIFVHEGQEVSAGEVIAEVGNNGFSTGPHLHFEVHTDEELTTVEPLAWLEEYGAVDVGELC